MFLQFKKKKEVVWVQGTEMGAAKMESVPALWLLGVLLTAIATKAAILLDNAVMTLRL